MEKMLPNFDKLQKNCQQFENKFVTLMQEMVEGNKGMKEAFDEFESNLEIMREKGHKEQEPGKQANEANLTEQLYGNVNFVAKKSNKWDSLDCGPKLTISDEGLEVKHSGEYNERNCVRAALPISKFNLAAKSIISYFEVEFVENPEWHFSIGIGFCTQQFPLIGNGLGNAENSIGIFSKMGMWIEDRQTKFENHIGVFHAGDIVGIGIIHSPAANSPMMKCFASCNGKLFGMADLPSKFAGLQLFPAVNLATSGDLIRANFGQNEWRFNPSQLVQ